MKRALKPRPRFQCLCEFFLFFIIISTARWFRYDLWAHIHSSWADSPSNKPFNSKKKLRKANEWRIYIWFTHDAIVCPDFSTPICINPLSLRWSVILFWSTISSLFPQSAFFVFCVFDTHSSSLSLSPIYFLFTQPFSPLALLSLPRSHPVSPLHLSPSQFPLPRFRPAQNGHLLLQLPRLFARCWAARNHEDALDGTHRRRVQTLIQLQVSCMP